MRTKLLLFLLLAGSVKSFGQIGFLESKVTGESFTTYSPELVRSADIDGDNDLDIVTYGRQLNWYENKDGLADFGEKNSVSIQSNGAVGTALYVMDFDNDGDNDILGVIANTLTVYKNTNGLGNFQVMQTFTLGFNYNTIPVVPVDIDGDGDMDIVCSYAFNSSPYEGKLVWFENNNNGSFGAEQVITTDNATLFLTSLLEAEDLDGDGDRDIIIGYKDYNKVAWIRNMGNGVFSAAIAISSSAGGISSITTSDMDNDGDTDIIASLRTDNQIVWYKNLNGLGNFSDENVIVSNAEETNSVLVTDINGDNTNDIVYTETNEIGWFSNDGSGNFSNPQVITNKAFNVRSVITADLDGDGKKDIISASQDDDKVAWYKHLDGNGNYGRQVVIARRIKFADKVYPADFDGDNDIDLLVNSHHDAKLTWFENTDGHGFYGKEHIITESVEVGNISPIAYPADIDGDGDTDIAAFKLGVLFWYENDGNGNFDTEHAIESTIDGVTIIRCKDLDGDGQTDIVRGVYNSNKISWYKNLGNGNFGPEQEIAAPFGNNGSLTSMEIADMDGDDHPEYHSLIL
ncbi:FG-GAP repeat domain-containing protein [Flavobacterium sp. 3HN19-14]|uniref:FG-GAP repeat domain-containing protein n=1 Tax=Flavobacterium sp. 3HN19-14 TaxID=3448133 RepID=UPI003EE31DBA